MFSKCLKNECDQEFRIVQDIAKDQIYQALKSTLRDRYQRIPEGEVISTAESLKSGLSGKMDKWIWRRTLGKLYKNEEKLKIELKIIEAIGNK